MKPPHSSAIESQFHWKSWMMTSVGKGMRMGRVWDEAERTFSGGLPGGG
jgi:hypothetical protein